MPDEFIEYKKYWLALSRIKNLGARKARLLAERFGSIEAIFSASFAELASSPRLGSELANEIIKVGHNIAKYEKIIKHISDAGIDVICPENSEYPDLLKLIKDPPTVLYKKGALPKAGEMSVAIVGTRFPTKEGLMIAQKIAERLASKNIIIVSGLAKGIDTSAHIGALNCGGKTVAVIGSGLKKIYPYENVGLAEKICNNGAIISECHPNEIVSKGRLIQRNRIISGLSLGIILVEPERGALNTAYWASKQNRHIYMIDSESAQETKGQAKNFLRIDNINELDMIIEQLGSVENSSSQVNLENQLGLF